jgi:hypothetical protein
MPRKTGAFKDDNYGSKGHTAFKKWVDQQGGISEAAQELLVAGFPTEHNNDVGMITVMKTKGLTPAKCAKGNLDKGLGLTDEERTEYKKAWEAIRKWAEGLYKGKVAQKSLVRSVWLEQNLGIAAGDWFKSYKFKNL